MKNYIIAMMAIISIMMTVACGNDSHKQAQALLEEASQLYDNRHYDKALATIDSLRKVFPNSVEVRKKALTLHQRISLSHLFSAMGCPKSLVRVSGRWHPIAS